MKFGNTNSGLNQSSQRLRQGVGSLRLRAATYWEARSAQERKLLTIGAVVAVLALFYALFVGPPLDGREQLRKQLPALNQEAAEMRALAQKASELASQPAPQLPAMTRASLTTALAARGLVAQSLSVTGEYAKLQFTGIQFASLVNLLDAIRKDSRIEVQDASITAKDAPGVADASITLRQAATGRAP